MYAHATLSLHEQKESKLYIFCEWASGGSVAGLLEKFGGSLPEEQMIRMYTYQVRCELRVLSSSQDAEPETLVEQAKFWPRPSAR